MAEIVPIQLYKEQDFSIGGLNVRPSLNRVSAGGKTVRLEPKVMKVLLVLWRADGAVVSREDLIREVWEGQAVTDDAITRCISRLRRLFAHDFPGPARIETVQKSGYRLVTGSGEEQTKRKLFTWAGGAALVAALALAAGITAWLQGRDRAEPDFAALPQSLAPFANFPGPERYPAFSPDGGSVAFAWRSPETGNYDLYRVDTEGEGRLRLTASGADEIFPVWSPDGARIAFGRIDGEGECEILAIPAIGGAERRLAGCAGRLVALDWAADGSRLLFAFQERPYAMARLYVLDPDTLERTPVPLPPGFALGVDDAAFSPDSRRIALTLQGTLGVEDIFVIDADGGNPVRLTSRHLKVHGLDWLADGSGLLASTNWLGAFGLWRVPVDGGAAEPVVNMADGIDHVAVSPQGAVLVERWAHRADVVALNPATGAETPLAVNSTRFEWDARPAPGGGRVAFVSDRSGAAELWVYHRESEAFSQLTDFGGAWTHSPRWSPDGGQIVFASPERGRFNLYLVSSRGGPLTHLTAGEGDNFAPVFSPDGRFVYFGSDRTGAWQVWRLELATGEQSQVTQGGGRAPQISPDGARLYFTRIDEAGLWRMPAGGGAPERVLDDLTPVDWNNWFLENGAIYYVRRPVPDTPELVRFDPASGETEVLAAVPWIVHNSGLWVAPGGGEVWLTRAGEAEADLLLAAPRR